MQTAALHDPGTQPRSRLLDSCGTLLQLPGVVVVKDLTSRLLAANPAFRALTGLSPQRSVAGHFEAELAPCLASAHDAFLAQDRDIRARECGKFLDVLRYPDGRVRAVVAHKVCLRDAEGAPVGLLFQGFLLENSGLQLLGAALTRHIDADCGTREAHSYALDRPVHEHSLSPREAECLFFLLRGYTARAVGHRLHLSPRTVESYIELRTTTNWRNDCSNRSGPQLSDASDIDD